VGDGAVTRVECAESNALAADRQLRLVMGEQSPDQVIASAQVNAILALAHAVLAIAEAMP
jgi:hypothetical protein